MQNQAECICAFAKLRPAANVRLVRLSIITPPTSKMRFFFFSTD